MNIQHGPILASVMPSSQNKDCHGAGKLEWKSISPGTCIYHQNTGGRIHPARGAINPRYDLDVPDSELSSMAENFMTNSYSQNLVYAPLSRQ